MNGAWWKTLLAAGPIGAVTAFLLLQSSGTVPSVAQETQKAVQLHQVQSQSQSHDQLKVLQQINKTQVELARLQRLSCLRVAQSEADRRACLGPEE